MPHSQRAPEPGTAPRKRRVYVPAVGPKLNRVLWVVSGLVALLGANSLYLLSITAYDHWTGETIENWLYQYMFLAHVLLGLLLVIPFVLFSGIHFVTARKRLNKRAIRVGYFLLACSVLVMVTGFLLLRVSGIELKSPSLRSGVYWAHIVSPLVVLWLYWLHRLAGRPIRWRVGGAYLAVVAVMVVGMVALHEQDPRKWNAVGPKSGAKYFEPSLARTSTGDFIPSNTLMMDHYCAECHQDAHADWSNSVHRFSSFNNPLYLASIRETRKVLLTRDGHVQASRFCAGCHDPVPFFAGAFDDPKFDDLSHQTAHAGITCTVCHSITHVNSPRGNADFTIDEPIHYPFAFSENPALKWINRQLVKANPEFHKKTFLKPLHKTTEFCGTCHKVHLPEELNHYKWLRGQNHYDSFLLSGVSGHGARSFYYPQQAEDNCNRCHMPFKESRDFGARFLDDSGQLKIHDHLFPAANTAMAALRGRKDVVAAHQNFLKDTLRVDLFGLRAGNSITGPLIAPLRPEMPPLHPGQRYTLDVVLRTLKLGHHFTQGTADSNEVWLEIVAKSGDRVIGQSGSLSPEGDVDPWAHFVNAFVVDRDGNRIARRNVQDIFTAVYNHQIPPGAAWTVHYDLQIPPDVQGSLTLEAKLQYRKFNRAYMDFVADLTPDFRADAVLGPDNKIDMRLLPVTTLAVDRITLPIEVDGNATAAQEATVSTTGPREGVPEWMRWNDYGIGLLFKGKSELRQAEEAFRKVETMGRYDGPLNLARVLLAEGRIDEAVDAIARAAEFQDPAAPPWTLAWLAGTANRQQGRLAEAAENFSSVLDQDSAERQARGFDFRIDYNILNELGGTLFDLARQQRSDDNRDLKETYLKQAITAYERSLEVDPENLSAHFNLSLLYEARGDADRAEQHREAHLRYKTDDTAAGRAVRAARLKYPAVNLAAEPNTIYPLGPPGGPGVASAEGLSRDRLELQDAGNGQ